MSIASIASQGIMINLPLNHLEGRHAQVYHHEAHTSDQNRES
jgi:hypothetical protein